MPTTKSHPFQLQKPNILAYTSRVYASATFENASAAARKLQQYGFELPQPTTTGVVSIVPVVDTNTAPGRLIPGVCITYSVPDHYAQTAMVVAATFDPLSPVTIANPGELELIESTAGVPLANSITAASMYGLEGALGLIEIREHAEQLIRTLPDSEETALALLKARLIYCDNALEHIRNSWTEVPKRLIVTLTVAGNPLDPSQRIQLIRCGDMWTAKSHLTEANRDAMIPEMVTLVKNQCGMAPNAKHIRAVTKSFQCNSPQINPDIALCNAGGYRAGVGNTGVVKVDVNSALCVHIASVIHYLGENGADSVFHTLHTAFPGVLDVGNQSVVDRLMEHIGLPATLLNLVGSSGTGKTEGVHEIQRRLALQFPADSVALRVFQCHPGATSADLVGRINQVLRGDTLSYEWSDGPLAQAWKLAAGWNGAKPKLVIMFLDEINRTPPQELQALIAMLSPDKNGYLHLQTRKSVPTEDGSFQTEVIKAPQENIIFVSAMNAGANFNVEQMDHAILSRMRIIYIGYAVEALVSTLKYHMGVNAEDLRIWSALLYKFHAAVTNHLLRAPLDLRQINRVITELKTAGLPDTFNAEDRIAFGMLHAISDFVNFTTAGALSPEEIATIRVIIEEATPNRSIQDLDDLYVDGHDAMVEAGPSRIAKRFRLN